MRKYKILAHWIGICEILRWDRKSYLTHVVLPRKSQEDFTLVVLELMHKVIKGRHCYVKVTSLSC